MKTPKRQTETIPKAKKNRKKRKSSCPEGWIPAGVAVLVRLTKLQKAHCQRAVGIARFRYNPTVATHGFHRVNRMKPSSWMDIYKEFNRA